MECSACRYHNPEGARFCSQCGVPLGGSCASCGAPVDPAHRFCQNCGARLGPGEEAAASRPRKPSGDDQEGERREVTVLFGDLTGFTSLSKGRDPEETHSLLNRYFDTVDGIIRSYGGAIDKHIGDGIMAVFGAPVAHSDDPERAMRAAIDIHAALAGMEPALTAHIGIASGTVVASGMGSAEHREYTVIGDSVNLASRLQDQARPGETLISGAVHRATARKFDCEALGKLQIKGLEDPVPVWKLVGLSTADDSLQSLPFVGRQAEISQFVSALAACRETGTGQTLLVRGEPGIGKTRLLHRFRGLAEDQGYKWHRGLVLDFGAGKGLDAIAAAIGGMLRIPLNADASEKSDAVAQAVTTQLIDDEQRVFLNDLLSLPQPSALRSLYDAMDVATRSSGREKVVADLVSRSVSLVPAVIAIEDIHWADRQTLSLLASMARACADSPALLILTSRFEGDPIDAGWRASAAGASLTTIDLGPLRETDALELASRYFKANENYARGCVKRAGGNPLFLEQLLRSVEETSESEIPGSVQSIVLTRMDHLDPPDRRALQAASVLGQRFDLDALRHVIGESTYDCRAPVEHFLVRPEGAGFLFAHALVRDGVYSSLLKSRRAELHRKAANWYGTRDLVLRAEHLDRADDPLAAEAYLAAAKEEARNYRNESALRLADRALEIAKPATISAIACFQGDLLRSLGEVERSISAFEKARDSAQDDLGRCTARIGLAEGLRVSDRHEEALTALDDAERMAPDGHPLLLAEIHHLRGNLYFPAGRADDCRAQHELALGYAREGKSKEWEARARGGLGDAAYLAGRMRTACENFRECVQLCQRLGLGRIEVANRNMVGWTRMYLNEIREACEDGLAAAEMAQQVGQNRAEMLGRFVAGFMFIEQGQLEAARSEVEKALVLADRLGAKQFVAEGLCFRAMILMAEGRNDDAQVNVSEALETVRDAGMTFFGPLALGLAARLAQEESVRRSFLAEGEAILGRGCVSHNYFWFYRDAIEACLAAEEWHEAERYCSALGQYAAGEPLPWTDLFVERGRALGRLGRGQRDHHVIEKLKAIADVAFEAGFELYLPAIRSALRAASSGTGD